MTEFRTLPESVDIRTSPTRGSWFQWHATETWCTDHPNHLPRGVLIEQEDQPTSPHTDWPRIEFALSQSVPFHIASEFPGFRPIGTLTLMSDAKKATWTKAQTGNFSMISRELATPFGPAKRTPLHEAAAHGRWPIDIPLSTTLQYPDVTGYTPLHAAAQFGELPIGCTAKLLKTTFDNRSRSAWDYLREFAQQDSDDPHNRHPCTDNFFGDIETAKMMAAQNQQKPAQAWLDWILKDPLLPKRHAQFQAVFHGEYPEGTTAKILAADDGWTWDAHYPENGLYKAAVLGFLPPKTTTTILKNTYERNQSAWQALHRHYEETGSFYLKTTKPQDYQGDTEMAILLTTTATKTNPKLAGRAAIWLAHFLTEKTKKTRT